MARGMTLAAAAAVVVMMMGVCVCPVTAFHKYAYYGYHGAPTHFYQPSVYNAPAFLPSLLYTTGPVTGGVGVVRGPVLPCPAEGFYVHPQNCSRFYRCVDHAGTGRFFVRHVFECSANSVFNLEVTTCLRGSCDSNQTAVQPTQPTVQPTDPPIQPTDPPVQPIDPPVQPTDPPVQPTDPPIQPTDPPVQPTDPPVQPTDPPIQPTDPPVQPTDPPVQPTDPPVQPTDPPVQPIDPPTLPPPTEPATTPAEDCEGPYFQHDGYCNVYQSCNDTTNRYICPIGSVFDQARQMCRIGAADEVLCENKAIAEFPFFLRTEIVEGHILLPDDFVLRPRRTFLTQSAPADTTFLRSQGSPAGVADLPPFTSGHSASHLPPHGFPFFEVPPGSPLGFPAPYHGLPADTIPQTVFSQPLPLGRPQPVAASYSYNTRYHSPAKSSVNNVRRPVGPLHFPHFPHYGQGIYYQ